MVLRRRLPIYLLVACGYPQPARVPDAEVVHETDANTMGWPTDGGVVPPPCTSAYDEDGDGSADDCDNCPLDPNDQADQDRDGIGDICDPHPPFAVERLAYFTGFNGTVASEGYKVGTPGNFAVEGSQLRQMGNAVQRTLFVLSGGPWRRPTVELKIANIQLNGTNSDFYAGQYLLNDGVPAAPEPRPDAVSCLARYGDNPGFRLLRIRDGDEVANAALPLTVGTGVTIGCVAERLGELASLYATNGDVAPAAIEARASLQPDSTDAEMSKIGVWTYYARADFSGLAVYESTYP